MQGKDLLYRKKVRPQLFPSGLYFGNNYVISLFLLVSSLAIHGNHNITFMLFHNTQILIQLYFYWLHLDHEVSFIMATLLQSREILGTEAKRKSTWKPHFYFSWLTIDLVHLWWAYTDVLRTEKARKKQKRNLECDWSVPLDREWTRCVADLSMTLATCFHLAPTLLKCSSCLLFSSSSSRARLSLDIASSSRLDIPVFTSEWNPSIFSDNTFSCCFFNCPAYFYY